MGAVGCSTAFDANIMTWADSRICVGTEEPSSGLEGDSFRGIQTASMAVWCLVGGARS